MDRRRFSAWLLVTPSLLIASRGEAAAPKGGAASDAAQAVVLITRIRAGYGQGPVTIDPRMNQAALHQARTIAQLGRLSHGDFAGRVRQFGLRGSMAENLAYGTIDVAGAVGQWQNSAPHMRNLLMPGATRMGLGRADKGKLRYWAMVIG